MKITRFALAGKCGGLAANVFTGWPEIVAALARSRLRRKDNASDPKPKLDAARNSRRDLTAKRRLHECGFIMSSFCG
jgi:hypothetical protein